MVSFLFVVQFFALGLLLVSMVQLVRVQLLSKAIHRVIDETFDRRKAVLDAGGKYQEATLITYPNIDATYANLKWYKPWQRPSTLIVYDKED